jgi:hydrogenase maturation protein HypF
MSPPGATTRVKIRVRGAVQGVGFRPFIYREATARGLAGWVGNTGLGVVMEVEGARIDSFLSAIRTAPPRHAVITAIETEAVAPQGTRGFTIRASEMTAVRDAAITPDLATCDACLAEMFDPRDRRYRHPFISCTDCGPRYSILEDVPYDRARTTMRHFPMCAACRAEYRDPASRRFHAEPIACPDCGPRLELWDSAGRVVVADLAALGHAADALRAGRIVAMKGIGGFHLLVDARDAAAVRRLRDRKRRPDKPFAVMFATLADIAAECDPTPCEAALLTGPERPIVLSRWRRRSVAADVAPGNPWIGAFLPYTPAHHLLLRAVAGPLVATSANRSGEPIVFGEQDAIARLDGIADLFLVHDRPIVRPVDDSVLRVVGDRPLMLRRSRGFAPRQIAVPGLAPGILALGGHLKATIAVTRADGVVAGQHLGDLDGPDGRAVHAAAVAEARWLHGIAVRATARDLHPDHAARGAAPDLPARDVQHHIAHAAACMADNGLVPPVLAITWDGTGYGPDGTIWGGEFLRITETGWHRVARLRPFRLPGGEAAVREPRRAALGLLYEAFGDRGMAMTDLPAVAAFTAAERGVIHRMLARGVNAPWCSSAGRLFDAIAALCGVRQRATYEGEAAAELEWAADHATEAGDYALVLDEDTLPMTLDWSPALDAMIADLRSGRSVADIAAAWHRGLAAASVGVARHVGEPKVVLTGGCFQNARLTEAFAAALRAAGFVPYWHQWIPPNDGGLAVGQAVWAGWRQAEDHMPTGEMRAGEIPAGEFRTRETGAAATSAIKGRPGETRPMKTHGGGTRAADPWAADPWAAETRTGER